MKNNISKSFCAIPFTEPYINTHGVYGVCCIEQENTGCKKYTVKESIEDHWNSTRMQEIRNSMLKGVLPSQCSICARQELVGKQSMRQRRNLRYFGKEDVNEENKQVKKILDATKSGCIDRNLGKKGILFSTGRLCQLGCISCSSSYSTFLEKEYEKLGYDPKFKDKKNPIDLSGSLSQKDLDLHLYERLKEQVKTLEYIQVTGGEPFISKKFFEFLNWLYENDHAKNITLLVTTNGMNLDREKIQILRKFKYSIIMFSIDGYEKVDDYLRYPSNWEEKIDNLKFLRGIADELVFASTVYSLNVFSLTDLIKFAQQQDIKIHLNTLEEPNFLHVRNIPDAYKFQIIQQLAQYKETHSIIKSLNQETDIENWQKTIAVIKDFDILRNLSFNKIETIFENFY